MHEVVTPGDALIPRPEAPSGLEHWRFLPDLPDDEYHGDSAVPSSTRLKPFLESKAHAAYEWSVGHVDSPSMQFGRWCHCAVLEPDRFRDAYAPGPDLDRSDLIRTMDDIRQEIRNRGETPKGARKDDLIQQLLMLDPACGARIPEIIQEAAEADAMGRDLIPWKDWVRVLGVRDAVARSQWCQALMQSAWFEASMYWVDPELQVTQKIRTDILNTLIPGRIIGDLKVVNNLQERALMRTIDDLHYDLSAAMYLAGAGARQFAWIFVSDRPEILVEGEPAHAVKIRYATRDGWLHTGHEKWRRALGAYAEAIRDDHWPCWEDRAEPIYPFSMRKN